MKIVEHKWSLLVLLHLLTEKSQSSWSGKIYIVEGQPFTIICDADAVSLPAQFQHLTYLFISKLMPNNPSKNVMTAMYRSYGTPDRYKTIPFGRNWNIKFSGQNTGSVTRQMRIKMEVLDSKPADSGIWRCVVRYTNSKGRDSTVLASLNLTVEGKYDILDKTDITEGERFSLTCDADHAKVDPKVVDIASINIAKRLRLRPPTYQVLAVNSPHYKKLQLANIPKGRKWTMDFSGSTAGKNNRNMRIVVLVLDSKCEDTGLYYCHVCYFVPNSNNTVTQSSTKTLNVQAQATNRIFGWELLKIPGMTKFPELSVYDILSMTCVVDGPSQNVSIVWKKGKFPGTGKTQTFENYFFQGFTTSGNLPSPSGSSCQRKRYTSVLKVILNKYEHSEDTFVCVLRERENDVVIGNMTTTFIDVQSIKATNANVSGSPKRQLSGKLLIFCLGFAVTMLRLRTDGEL